MPDACCVPGCRGNYRATKNHPFEKVSVFKFPSNEDMRAKWVRMIPREGLTVNAKTVVCEKHFADQFIIRFDSAVRPDGSVLTVRRGTPKLTADAYPSIFPNVPSYLSEEPPTKRKAPDDRRAEMSARDDQLFNNFLEQDQIRDYEDLMTKLSDHIKDYTDWITVNKPEYVSLCYLTVDDIPKLHVVIRINVNVNVTVFVGGVKLGDNSLEWLLGKGSKLTLWSQLENLLSRFTGIASENLSPKDVICSVENLLRTLSRSLNDADDDNFDATVVSRLDFLTDQLLLLFKMQRRYSPETLVFAFRLLCVSRVSYNLVRDRVLQLPHVSYLRRLSGIFNMNITDHDSDHIIYLREKLKVLQPHERHIVVLLDEIHVIPKISYKGGSLIGIACNSETDKATTVQAFMICSVLSGNKDMAAMLPVKGLTAEYLLECTQKVIHMLENIGYSVICLASDNNRVNRNMFTALCDGELKPSIPHPCDNTRKLFFLFDTVHLMKSIRNNWIGQNDNCKSFVFPPFPVSDSSEPVMVKASFSHLRDLHSFEKDNIVKLAPNLTFKALYPSNLERQNVKLALKVFDEKTHAALGEYGKMKNISVEGTQTYISVIIKLWKIFNIKTTSKGFRKRDDDCHPFRGVDDHRLVFLDDVSQWLCAWEKLNQKQREGRLTNETHAALVHTVNCYRELICYLFNDLHFTYVLTSKFQTDPLEARFGKHRRMAGTNYHVSVREVKESEKRLTIMSMLHVISASKGKISFTEFIEQCTDSVSGGSTLENICTKFPDLFDMCDTMGVEDSEAKSLIFISGYVAFKVVTSKVDCDLCKSELITDQHLLMDTTDEQNSYLTSIDRGGLKWPTEFLVECVSQMLLVFKCVISEKFEALFLSLSNHKSVLIELFKERLNGCCMLEGKCVCGVTISCLMTHTTQIVANIFLNNYSKRSADKEAITKDKCKFRKLSTLTKNK